MSMPAFWTRAMTAVDPSNDQRVLFARSSDVALSTNAGDSVAPCSLPDNAQPVSVYIDPTANHYLYVGTLGHGAYRSTDGGATWAAWGLAMPTPTAVLNIAYSSAAGGTYFLATTSGLYRLLPGATSSWTRQTPFSNYTVSDVDVDPHCPTRLYISYGFVGTYGQHRGGISVSSNNGDTFTSITSGLPIHQAPIADVQVDLTSSQYVYAGVYGRGA
jgi:hypothetical protein